MQSSLLTVLPLPVGAPSSTFSSVWYSVWNACDTKHTKPHPLDRLFGCGGYSVGRKEETKEVERASARLRLDRVEVREAPFVEGRIGLHAERRPRQRPQRQQVGVRRVPLRQQQPLEGDLQEGLAAQPRVAHLRAHAPDSTSLRVSALARSEGPRQRASPTGKS